MLELNFSTTTYIEDNITILTLESKYDNSWLSPTQSRFIHKLFLELTGIRGVECLFKTYDIREYSVSVNFSSDAFGESQGNKIVHAILNLFYGFGFRKNKPDVLSSNFNLNEEEITVNRIIEFKVPGTTLIESVQPKFQYIKKDIHIDQSGTSPIITFKGFWGHDEYDRFVEQLSKSSPSMMRDAKIKRFKSYSFTITLEPQDDASIKALKNYCECFVTVCSEV